MSQIVIRGGRPLAGELTVQGAKNSALPILAATVLHPGKTVLRGCPHLSDVDASVRILRHLGCSAQWVGEELVVDASGLDRWDVPDHLMREMRSSVIFLGAILARMGWAEISYPGGCELGPGPSTCTCPPCGSWGQRCGRRAADCAARDSAWWARRSP